MIKHMRRSIWVQEKIKLVLIHSLVPSTIFIKALSLKHPIYFSAEKKKKTLQCLGMT